MHEVDVGSVRGFLDQASLAERVAGERANDGLVSFVAIQSQVSMNGERVSVWYQKTLLDFSQNIVTKLRTAIDQDVVYKMALQE